MSVAIASSLTGLERVRETNRLREEFLTAQQVDLSSLRPMVARSWYRSRAAGIDGLKDRGYLEEGRVDEHTIRAAEEHLRNLDVIASDMGGYVSLTAPNGALVHPSYLRAEEGFPEGYSLLEDSAGSNGEGLAIEEGRGVWLAPEEHFREDMRGNWCFASLVRDPFHNRVRAVIGLTFPADSVLGIEPATTLLLLEGIASRIEREIELRTSSRERTLLSEYLMLTRRRGNAAVIAIDGKNTLMNSAASAALEEGDFSIINGYAKSVITSGNAMNSEVMLTGMGAARLEVSPVSLSKSNLGATVVVRPLSTVRGTAIPHVSMDHDTSSRTSDLAGLIDGHFDGVSNELHRMIGLAGRAVERGRSVVILGEVGTGKRRLAEAVASNVASQHVYDASREAANNLDFENVLLHLSSVETPMAFTFHHADELSPSEASAIIGRVSKKRNVRLILTATRHTEATLQLSESCDAIEIDAVPLRTRREDIPILATAIANELGRCTLSRRLLSALTDADWPRNIDQLKAVISNVVERATGGEATVDDLPQGFQLALTNGRLSRLEDAELRELRNALQEAEGNRRLAAEMLEIGRSTLYRRMDYFRSRGFEL